MYEIIPFQTKKDIKTHLKNYIFLLSSNHGNAHLGMVINGYGFISPKPFKQSTQIGEDAVSLYKTLLRYPFKEIPTNKNELSRFANNLEKNLRNFKIVISQSNKPLKKEETQKLKRKNIINKIKFIETPHRLYYCGIDYVPKIDSEELIEYLEEDLITKKQFISEHIRRQIKNKKKKFAPQLLNLFEILECLTYQITEDTVEYKTSSEDLCCFYGSMQKYTPDIKIPQKLN